MHIYNMGYIDLSKSIKIALFIYKAKNTLSTSQKLPCATLHKSFLKALSRLKLSLILVFIFQYSSWYFHYTPSPNTCQEGLCITAYGKNIFLCHDYKSRRQSVFLSRISWPVHHKNILCFSFLPAFCFF